MRRESLLPAERVRLLEKAGIVWDPNGQAWDDAFARWLNVAPDAYGRRAVARGHVTEDGFKLGEWQATQRTRYRRGLLTEARAVRLNESGFIWAVDMKGAKGARQPSMASAREPKPFGADPRCAARSSRDWLPKRRLDSLRKVHAGRRRAAAYPRAEAGAEVGAEGGGEVGAVIGAEIEAVIGAEIGANGIEAWHEEWRERFGCWWIALDAPTQSELGNCLGALSLHVGSRLSTMLGRQPPRGGGGVGGGVGRGVGGHALGSCRRARLRMARRGVRVRARAPRASLV